MVVSTRYSVVEALLRSGPHNKKTVRGQCRYILWLAIYFAKNGTACLTEGLTLSGICGILICIQLCMLFSMRGFGGTGLRNKTPSQDVYRQLST